MPVTFLPVMTCLACRLSCCCLADRPFETMLAELKRLKEEYPDRILIASIMEEYNK